MRILHVISGIDPLNGGTTAAVVGIAEAQAAAGLDVTVFSSWVDRPGESNAERLRRQGVQVHLIGPCRKPLSSHRHMVPTLERLISQSDVVHAHAMWEEIQHHACRVAHRMEVPYVITPHGMLDTWSMSKGWLKKHLYLLWRMRRNLNQASLVHFTTCIEQEGVRRLKLRAPEICEPLGIRMDEFETLPPAGTFRSRFTALANRPFVIYLGRLHAGKGLETLVPAFARAGVDDRMLVLAGPDSGGFQKMVEGWIREHRLEDRVIFTGMLHGPERVAALAEAELFCLPSFHENFGISVIEALACGTPVIISDQVNVHREVSAAGVGGVVPLDTAATAAELKRWLTDTSLRSVAANKARDFVREHYDWRRIAQNWVHHYARFCGGERSHLSSS